MRNFNKRRHYGLFLTVLCALSSIGTAAPAVFSLKEKKGRAENLEIDEKNVTFFNSGKAEAGTHFALNLVFWALVVNALQLGVDGFTGATTAAKDAQDLETRTFSTKLKAAAKAMFTRAEWNRHLADMKAVAQSEPNRDGITETLMQRLLNYANAKPVFVGATLAQVVIGLFLGIRAVRKNNKLRAEWTAAEADYATTEKEFTSAQKDLGTVSGTPDTTAKPTKRSEMKAKTGEFKTKTAAAQAEREVADLAAAHAELTALGLADTTAFTTSAGAQEEKARVKALLAGTDLAALRGLKKLLTAEKATELKLDEKIAALQTRERDVALNRINASFYLKRTLHGKTTHADKLSALSKAEKKISSYLNSQNINDVQRLNYNAILVEISKVQVELMSEKFSAVNLNLAIQKDGIYSNEAPAGKPKAQRTTPHFNVPAQDRTTIFNCEAEGAQSSTTKAWRDLKTTRSATPPAGRRATVPGSSGSAFAPTATPGKHQAVAIDGSVASNQQATALTRAKMVVTHPAPGNHTLPSPAVVENTEDPAGLPGAAPSIVPAPSSPLRGAQFSEVESITSVDGQGASSPVAEEVKTDKEDGKADGTATPPKPAGSARNSDGLGAGLEYADNSVLADTVLVGSPVGSPKVVGEAQAATIAQAGTPPQSHTEDPAGDANAGVSAPLTVAANPNVSADTQASTGAAAAVTPAPHSTATPTVQRVTQLSQSSSRAKDLYLGSYTLESGRGLMERIKKFFQHRKLKAGNTATINEIDYQYNGKNWNFLKS